METTKSSKFGIISCLLWLALVLLGLVGFAVFFYLAVLSGRNLNLRGDGAQELFLTTAGVVLMAIPVVHIAALVSGVIGLIRREPKRFFAIAGVVLNGLALLGIVVFGVFSAFASRM